MSNEGNAKFHLKYICPNCPEWRRKRRQVYDKKCFWEDNWKKGNYDLPRVAMVGPKNFFNAVFSNKVDFKKFREKLEKDKKLKFSK